MLVPWITDRLAARKNRPRWTYVALTLAAILLGVASRRYALFLPPLLQKNAGDVIWGGMVFLGARALLPHVKIERVALSALLFAWGVEFLKLYDPSWLHAVRATTVGWLVLGHGFHVSNLICYGLGIGLGMLGGAFCEWRSRSNDMN